MTTDPMPRRLGAHAAALFFFGCLTGALVAAAMSGKIDANPQSMLSAHLNGIQGCFWLVALGWTWSWHSLGDSAQRWLFRLSALAAWSNWLVTILKSFLQVHGIDLTGDPANDAIFALLNSTVVLPTLAGGGLWAWGLRHHLWPAADGASPRS
jgi:hypothetical protein